MNKLSFYMKPITLYSQIDPSTNTFFNGFESRFVTRDKEAIIYLSSSKGCDRACRMCHLTQTKQTDMTAATLEDFLLQAKHSIEMASKYFPPDETPPSVVHFNFMARGEPFLNEVVMDNWNELSDALLELAKEVFPGVPVKFKISTIGAGLYETNETGVVVGGYADLPFTKNYPEIYYSLYSVKDDFRRQWLPKAESPTDMLRLLSRYARNTGTENVIHGAFITGHNDDFEDIRQMLNLIRQYPLIKKFNIVRFNSPDSSRWSEPDEAYLNGIADYITGRGMQVQMVSRVGVDVYASCGMFISPKELETKV